MFILNCNEVYDFFLATLRVAGSLQKSTDVMKSMQNLCKIPEISRTMQELSKEMMKAGIIEEMMEDVFESALGDDDLEKEADEEVDKLLFELTAGKPFNMLNHY